MKTSSTPAGTSSRNTKMTITELIKYLEAIKERAGDIPVVIETERYSSHYELTEYNLVVLPEDDDNEKVLVLNY